MVADLWENKVDIRIPSKAEMEAKSPLKRDIWTKILDDDWMWGVVWGKPRTGKTTIQLLCSYDVYGDWDLVIQSCFFNLNGFLYKLRKGEPCRVLTLNQLHWRIPILLPDDFGAQCNKAKIQHEPAWDIVKGAWDTFGTRVGVMLGSMGTPSGATQQIQEKYTHEIFVYQRGNAKYDEVEWRPDFRGWRPNPKKDFLHDFEFGFDVPMDIYKQYDELRSGLVDDLLQQIDDAQIETEGTRLFKLLTDKDIELIEYLAVNGAISKDWIRKEENTHLSDAFKRCKNRGIIVPLHRKTSYWYDLTELGAGLLRLVQARAKEGAFAPTKSAEH